jgi:hypothetical protein
MTPMNNDRLGNDRVQGLVLVGVVAGRLEAAGALFGVLGTKKGTAGMVEGIVASGEDEGLSLGSEGLK